MSRRSQQKRAARAKARAKERARTGTQTRTEYDYGDFGGSGEFGFAPPPRLQTSDLLDAACEGVAYPLWIDKVREADQDVFLAEAEMILVAWVQAFYSAGWQPTEAIRYIRSTAKSGGAELARLAMAAERDARVGPTASDIRWQRQWRAAELPEAALSAGWLKRWATHEQWAKELYRFGRALGRLPILDTLLPPPPGVRPRKPLVGIAPKATTDPVLERVRALLAKAESTEHESEALLFTGKAQELMTRHAISQAMLADADDREAVPRMIRIPIDTPYADAKALLIQTIAEHTRCRAILMSSVGLSSVVGFTTDLEAVEMLFTSLLVQAQHALAELGAQAPPGSRVRSQPFKASFLQGFIGRIGARLTEVNREAFDEAHADASVFLPVLRARDEQVEEFLEQQFGGLVESRVRGGYDPAGYSRGQQAGAKASLPGGKLESRE